MENNLEYDLYRCEWIINKCKNSINYSQNIYAALCNNVFVNKENSEYSCTWRHAGSIVSGLNKKGSYVDWYCSGIAGIDYDQDPLGPMEEIVDYSGFMPEGTITDEVKQDFLKLGWIKKT